MTTTQKFQNGYSPLWSPGDPVDKSELLTMPEKEALVEEMKSAGNFTQDDENAFWAEDQPN